MPPRTLKPLETQPRVQGIVRTDVRQTIGTQRGSGFSVDFQIIYEIHGSYTPGGGENASLLVISARPMIKKYKQQFLNFKVKLSVRTLYEDDNECHIAAFEPAIKGAQFYDVYTTNEEVQRMIQGNAEVTAASTASLGGQASVTKSSKFTKTYLLQVKSSTGQNPPLFLTKKPNYVLWDIRAASKEQGVGDSFTMALLIKRPVGASFQLFAEVDGDVGSWSMMKKKLESIMPRQAKEEALATFPLSRSNSPLPPGIQVDHLHKASTDNVIQRLEDIGIHLPELARPAKGDKEAISATSLELSVAKGNLENHNATESPMEPIPSQLVVPPVPTTDTHSVDNLPATRISPPSIPVNAQTQLEDPTTTATLTSIMRDLSLLTRSITRHDELSVTPVTTSRIRRHREMANAYERLAELYRDEAKELQLWEDSTHRTGECL